MKPWGSHLVTWVTAGSGLLTAIVGFFSAGEELLGHLGLADLPRAVLVAVGVVLLCVATIAYWINRPRSRLKDPSQLQLRREDTRHLKGREHDVDRLMRKCQRESIVELQGLSGCGKSALIRAGLLPQLAQSPSLLPLLFEYDGSDWERAPEEALLREIDKAMDACRDPGVPKSPAPDIVQGLRSLKQASRRTPLLIFDQVDDYLQTHQAIFITAERSTLRSDALIESNRFWAAVARAVVAGDARMILVARAEMASWLISFRFVPSDDYHLPAVEARAIRSMLTGLGDPALNAIEDAACGWNDLVGDIVDDTTVNGLILPQRLRLVLGGLEGLRWLTPEEYRRAGRNVGVEGLYVDSAVSRAAGASQLTPSAVRSILRELVDPEQLKTRRRTLAELTAILDPAAPPELLDQVTIAVQELAARAVVRFVFDPTCTAQGNIVQLDHDYLAPAIIRSNRQANRWSLLLQERSSAFRSAGWNPFKRWQALLSVRDLARALWARVAGHADAPVLTGHVGFVSLSTLSLLVPLAAIAITGFIGRALYEDFRFQRNEGSIISAMGSIISALASEDAGRPTVGFWKHLRTLPHRPLRQRRLLLVHALSDPNATSRVGEALPVFVRGITGASSDARADLARAVQNLDDTAFTPAQLIARDSVLGLLDTESKAPASTLVTNALQLFEEIQDVPELPAPFLHALETRISTSTPAEKAEAARLICGRSGFWHQARFIECPGNADDDKDDDSELAELPALAERLKSATSDRELIALLHSQEISRSREERLEWYRTVMGAVGNERLNTLLRTNSSWAWETPLAEFYLPVDQLTNINTKMKMVSTVTSNSREVFRSMLAYTRLDPSRRREVQGEFRRRLFLGHSFACGLYRQFRPELGADELRDFVHAVLARDSRPDASACLSDDDISVVSKTLVEAAPTASDAGHVLLREILSRMPESKERNQLVSILRAAYLSTLQARENDPRVPGEQHQIIWNVAGVLLDEHLLRASLSADDLDTIWHAVTVEAREYVTSLSPMADVQRWQELVKRPIGPDLTRQIVELLETRQIEAWAGKDLLWALTLLPAEQIIGSLPPDARQRIAAGIFANLCDSKGGNSVHHAIRLLSAALGTTWNEEPWLTRRQRLADFPWAYGMPTDALLGDALPYDPERSDRAENQHQWYVWKRVATFREKHGGAFDSREARKVCVAVP